MARTYSLKDIACAYGEIALDGHGMVEFAMDEDGWTKQVGDGGEVTFVNMTNDSGTFSVTLPGSHRLNLELSREYDRQKAGGPAKPFTLRDALGDTEISTPQARIKRKPDVALAKDGPGERKWEFLTDIITEVLGGNE